MIGGGEAERRIRQDREEGDEKGAGQHRGPGVEIDEKQRCDGDDRRHLQDDCDWQQCPLDPFRLRKQDRQRDAADDGERQRFERRAERDGERGKQDRAISQERRQH